MGHFVVAHLQISFYRGITNLVVNFVPCSHPDLSSYLGLSGSQGLLLGTKTVSLTFKMRITLTFSKGENACLFMN